MMSFSPVGVYEWTPQEAHRHHTITQTLRQGFESHGFQAVRSPVIDDLNSLRPGLDETLISSLIHIHHHGHTHRILRPDHTTPIARMVATRMPTQLPLKLYYMAPIFRQPTHDWEAMEQFQAGCEWIGPSDQEADWHTLALCLSQLQQIGLTQLAVDIGHVGFLAPYSPQEKRALLDGDYVALGHVPQRGGLELTTPIPELGTLFRRIQSSEWAPCVSVFTGLVPTLSYYTGFVFSVMAPGFRAPIATGGRYDGLMSRFGLPCPAVGFAIHLNEIMDHT